MGSLIEHSAKDTIAALKKTRDHLVNQAAKAKRSGDPWRQTDCVSRKQLLETTRRDLEERTGKGPLPPVIFVSFSSKKGKKRFEYIKQQMDERGFSTRTGFEASAGDQANVLSRVLRSMEQSTLFLGIFTKEHRVQSKSNARIRWAPSIWLLEEKGMAEALRMPFAIMVEEGIDEDFWTRTALGEVYTVFNRTDFEEKAKEVMDKLVEKYERRLNQYLGTADLT